MGDPKITMETVLSRLSSSANINQANLELYKCYSTKSMMKRPAEFPVELESERNLESLLEWCKEGTKTVYYRLKTEPRKSGSVTPMPHPVCHRWILDQCQDPSQMWTGFVFQWRKTSWTLL